MNANGYEHTHWSKAHRPSRGAGVTQRRGKRERNGARGQSLTELALILPILLSLLLAGADFARVLAIDVQVQNAAKQAAVFASRHANQLGVAVPLQCLQAQTQQIVNDELKPTQQVSVDLATVTPPSSSAAYPGESDVQANVAYPFTFITPFLWPWGNTTHPLMVRARQAEHAITPPTTGTDPGSPQNASVARGATGDTVSWQMPNVTVDTSAAAPVTTTFHVFQTTMPGAGGFASACPVGPTVTGVTSDPSHVYSYTWDHDQPDTTTYYYWIVAYAPATLPKRGTAGTPVLAS